MNSLSSNLVHSSELLFTYFATPTIEMSNTSRYSSNRERREAEERSSTNDSNAHYAQIVQEANHKMYSQVNQKQLLDDKLDAMRGLIQNLQETDWMYKEDSLSIDGLYSLNTRDKGAPQKMGNGSVGEARHFSLGRRL